MLNPQELHSAFVSGKRVNSLGVGEAEGKGERNFVAKCMSCSCKELSGGANA